MFRQASLILGAIVLIAGIYCRPSVSMAWDDAKAGPNKEAEKEQPDPFEKVELGEIEDAPPAELDVDPTLEKPARAARETEYNDQNGSRTALLASGGDKVRSATGGHARDTQRAVAAALVWLANHQMPDGSWSLQNFPQRCKPDDKTCTGPGAVSADAGATAMGLLPFLAAGQTHKSPGPYKDHVRKGLDWLIAHQQNGNLAKGARQMMYSHGLATIALAEAYGLTADKRVGLAAQTAVNFILAAQNPKDGGWRYNPGDPGDTSVLGWQLTALKIAKLAGLNVGGSVFANAGKYLDSVSVHGGAEYGYVPGAGASNTMTAVGLLGRQFLGANRDNPMLTGGMRYLLNHLPEEQFSNIYYWYYATQVMHNMSGNQWDTWNRKMRDLLVRTQVRNVKSCANGSWDPALDAWGKSGGRIMQTSLSTLTLEVVYRRFGPQVFKADESAPAGNASPSGNDSKKPEKKEPEKFDRIGIDDIEEPVPPELEVDPTLEEPARGAVPAGKGIGIGQGSGIVARGSGNIGGGTRHTERTVIAALAWLANHQMPDGSWSLQNYTQRCKDKTCTGAGSISADAGATALGLLPFLAAGWTHRSSSPYKEPIRKGLEWLIAHQKDDGDLRGGANMYSHGLATIAFSEDYGLTGDARVGKAAQAAVNFILAAQNRRDGGWRYNPGDAGDTSVLGWQLMALTSARMAGLKVDGGVFTGAGKFLDSVALRGGTEYGYQPGGGSSPTMTAVGLLGRQLLGADRNNPMLTGGRAYMISHLPDEKLPNVYYWYYGTKVVHNMAGYEWHTWNRKMRDLLVRTQVRNADQCA